MCIHVCTCTIRLQKKKVATLINLILIGVVHVYFGCVCFNIIFVMPQKLSKSCGFIDSNNLPIHKMYVGRISSHICTCTCAQLLEWPTRAIKMYCSVTLLHCNDLFDERRSLDITLL